MIGKTTIDSLIAALGDLVSDDKPWRDKRKLILENMDDRDKTNLSEFVAWFDEIEIEE